MLNICDAEFLGKTISEGELNMNITKSYYGDKPVDTEEAKILLKKASIINMVGNKIIFNVCGSWNWFKKWNQINFRRSLLNCFSNVIY